MKKSKKSGSKKPAKRAVSKKATSTKPSRSMAKSSIGITPMNDRVVVRPLTMEEAGLRSASGIILPETVDKEKSEQGIVVAIGPGKITDSGDRTPVSVTMGDRVLFSKYGFEEVKLGGVEYYIIGEPSILAILNS